MQLEPERLRLEQKSNRSGGKGKGSKSGMSCICCFGETRSHNLRHFIDGNDDLDNYQLQFERHVTVAN